MFCVEDRDVVTKMENFKAICGAINRTLGNKVRRDTKLRFLKNNGRTGADVCWVAETKIGQEYACRNV